MSFIRTALVAATILSFATPEVIAQTDSQTQRPSLSSKIDDVTNWTSEQWNKAKVKWAQEKEKWADCQKQADDKKLSGRESWSFLATCMTN
jgi:hypothetical protein